MTDRDIVETLEVEWTLIDRLCSGLADAEWQRATDCPGWTVQDQLSHLVAGESRLLGRPSPEHKPRDLSHVKNEIGERNEVVVDWRRSWLGIRVLEEFREVKGERLRALRAMGPYEFEVQTQTPIGRGTVRDLLSIRLFDAWVHEQDIRRAVGIPGNLEGPIAEYSVGRVAMAMPFVIAKKAQASDGATVAFDVTGPAGRVLSVTVEGKRARELDEPLARPTVRLVMNLETFVCLGCGRWEPHNVIESGQVRIEGDLGLGESIVEQMNIMP